MTIVPEQTHAVLEDASLTNEKYLLLRYLHNVQNKIFVVPLESVENHVNNHRIANGEIHVNGSITSEKTVVGVTDEWIGLPDAEQLDLPVGCSVNSTSCSSRQFKNIHSLRWIYPCWTYLQIRI